ncbi:MAG: ABC transporter substrate-binding protein [Rhodospirillaceae bacterium]|jgi:glycine betaine/proline transport system substrate-binding protein|nr:ABC transporter substrate-binding protein [Rhodospirillaceae bacterium]
MIRLTRTSALILTAATTVILAAATTKLWMPDNTRSACGNITISEMNWASAQLMANVDKIILQKGYGCNTEIVPGDTMPTFTSMSEKGRPDIAPELWINAVREPLKKAIDSGRLQVINKAPITGLGEGWWVTPSFLKKHPTLNTVEKVLSRPDLFPYAEDRTKGAFIGCPAGWGCQLANANLYRAFKMKQKGWVLVNPGSGAGLKGSIAKAANRGENWFGYYWNPTAIVGKYNLIKLPFETKWAGSNNWDGCIVKPEQDCADPKPSSWTKSAVRTVITTKFSKRGGVAAKYLENRIFPGDVMNSMLVFMNNEKANGADTAIEFLRRHSDVWIKWVSKEAAKKIKASL